MARVWTFTKSGIIRPEAAAAQAQHRVLLVHRLDRREQLAWSSGVRRRRRRRVTLTSCSSRFGRNSCSGGSIRRMTTGRPSIARKMPSKSPCWRTSSLAIAASNVATASRLVGVERRRRPPAWPWPGSPGWRRGSRRGRSRAGRPRGTCARCGTGRCPARRSPGLGGLLGLVGVRPDPHPPDLVGPAQDLLELGLVLEPRLDRRQRADVQRAGRAVEADPVALLELGAGHVAVGLLAGVVDDEVGRAGHARLADLAGDDRGVRGRAAAGRDDALGHGHAVEVVGRGLDPDEDDLLAALDPLDRACRRRRRPGRRRRRARR